MTVVLDLVGVFLRITNIYAPVSTNDEQKKVEIEKFWRKIEEHMKTSFVPGKPNFTIIGGDFNAQIGRDAELDGQIGKNLFHGVSNFSGRLVKNFVEKNNLNLPKSHRSSRISPPVPTFKTGAGQSEIDFFLISNSFKNAVGSVKTKEQWSFKDKHTHRAQLLTMNIPKVQLELTRDHFMAQKRGAVMIKYDLKKLAFATKKLRAIETKEDNQEEPNNGNDSENERDFDDDPLFNLKKRNMK